MILHVDMDAFYASIEERDRPELAGQPLIVGGAPERRGVVAAANYAVRKFGVHSAMPTSTALRRCPHAIVLPTRIDYYARVSAEIRRIFFRYTPLVEPLSLDEAFLDVAASEAIFGPASEIGQRIKQEVRRELGLVASVGVAPNKFLAKVASDLDKPDGFVVVHPQRITQFLDPLPVGRLWGVGRVTGQTLKRRGIHTVGQLRALPREMVQRQFGKLGDHLWRLAHGQDDRPVAPEAEAKSISHETTFPRDIDDIDALRAWTLELAEQVACRLRRKGLKGRTVHLKVRYHDFHTITRAQRLAAATDVTREICETAATLLDHRLPRRRLLVRLLGVGVSGLEPSSQRQQMLFDEHQHEVQTRLDRATDQIRARFGSDALNRGSCLWQNTQHRPAPRPAEDKRPEDDSDRRRLS
jgi:DNA polymerase-4